MKKLFQNLGIFILVMSILAPCLVSCAGNSSRRKHGGYDSQTWIPKSHKSVNFRTKTGYPRSR